MLTDVSHPMWRSLGPWAHPLLPPLTCLLSYTVSFPRTGPSRASAATGTRGSRVDGEAMGFGH